MISESLGRIGVSSLINLKKKEFKRMEREYRNRRKSILFEDAKQ